jgi:hypothetical protein
MKKILAFVIMSVLELQTLINNFSGALQIVFKGSQNAAVVRSHTFYVAGLASDLSANNGSTLSLITQKTPGYNNIGSNKLPAGMSFIIEEVCVLFEADATKTPLTGVFTSVAPPSFANGEFKIDVSGTGECFSSAGCDVTNKFASTSNEDNFRAIKPILIASQTEFDFIFKTVGSYTGLYKVMVRGTLFAKPSKN